MPDVLKLKQIILFALDLVLIFSALPITLIIAFGDNFNLEIFRAHFFPFLFIYAFLAAVFYINGLYEMRSFTPGSSALAKLLIAHGSALVFGIIIFYFSTNPEITPKTNLLLNMVISFFLVSAWRLFFQRFVSQHLKIKVAIAGMNDHAKELAGIINKKPYVGYSLIAAIRTDESQYQDSSDSAGKSIKIFNIDKDLSANLKSERIETVITSENLHLNPLIAQAFYECIPYKIRFLDLAQSYEILTGRIPISYITQAWFLDNINEYQKRLYTNLKRITDLVTSSLIFIFSLPLWVLIALAIKFDSKGPVFYLQERVGANKKLFKLIKFRSMIENAETNLPVWAEVNDPRVTSVGKFLRRTHLDELPQMINIIKGDISLVGPRPERIEFVRALEGEIPHYNVRHIIKPGFTGWAQVNFRYARTPMDTYEKFQYDLYYLKNRSIILDIAIILKTVKLLFSNANEKQ